jgi:hypothetical protein
MDPHFIKDCLIKYLAELFKDLMNRQIKQVPGLSQEVFIDYLKNLPEIVSTRVFEIADINQNGIIEVGEFVECFIRIFIAPIDEKIQLAFRIFDFDNDGKVNPEDVKILMSYIDFNTGAEGSASDGQMSPREGNYTKGISAYVRFMNRVSQ